MARRFWACLIAWALVFSLGILLGTLAHVERPMAPTDVDQRAVRWVVDHRDHHPNLVRIARVVTSAGNAEVTIPAVAVISGVLLRFRRHRDVFPRSHGLLGNALFDAPRRPRSTPLGAAIPESRRRGRGASRTAFPRGAWERGKDTESNVPLFVFLLVAGGGQLLTIALKEWFRRDRPDLADRLAVVRGYSFPSGHAMFAGVALVLAIVATFLIVPRRKWAVQTILIASAILFSLSVAASRIWLGVHYLTDVLSGFSLGVGWASAVTAIHFRGAKSAQLDGPDRG